MLSRSTAGRLVSIGLAGLTVAIADYPEDLVFLAIAGCFAAHWLGLLTEGLSLGLLWLGAELAAHFWWEMAVALMALGAGFSVRAALAHARSIPPRPLSSAVLLGMGVGMFALLFLPVWGGHQGFGPGDGHWHFIFETGHVH